ncbi:MAG: FAD binding domain-containing protein, partial [Armatimonadota bacterium]
MATDEILLEVQIPPLPPRTGRAFVEVARRHGDFALVGAAALVHLDGDGRIDLARLGLCGVGGIPYCPGWIDMSLRGVRPAADLFQAVGLRVRDEVEPDGDIHARVEYRRKVAGVMTVRALAL